MNPLRTALIGVVVVACLSACGGGGSTTWHETLDSWCSYAVQTNGTRLILVAAGSKTSELPVWKKIARLNATGAPAPTRAPFHTVVAAIQAMHGPAPRAVTATTQAAAAQIDRYVVMHCKKGNQ